MAGPAGWNTLLTRASRVGVGISTKSAAIALLQTSENRAKAGRKSLRGLSTQIEPAIIDANEHPLLTFTHMLVKHDVQGDCFLMSLDDTADHARDQLHPRYFHRRALVLTVIGHVELMMITRAPRWARLLQPSWTIHDLYAFPPKPPWPGRKTDHSASWTESREFSGGEQVSSANYRCFRSAFIRQLLILG